MDRSGIRERQATCALDSRDVEPGALARHVLLDGGDGEIAVRLWTAEVQVLNGEGQGWAGRVAGSSVKWAHAEALLPLVGLGDCQACLPEDCAEG